MIGNKYVKSPLNYIGGKYKLLDKIIPLFPDGVETFMDLFGGGFNVGLNVDAKCVIYNDKLTEVVDFLRCLQKFPNDNLLDEIDGYIREYGLTKENRDGYLALREDYNAGNKTPMKFYTLVCYSFNNQIRFNGNGKYNMPFGKGRSFNPALRKKFIEFHAAIRKKKCYFLNNPADCILFDRFSAKDFVYADPPYLNSIATYNEKGGWTEMDESRLLNSLDFLNMNGVKFALSNNLKFENHLLDKWKVKYNVHHLQRDYSNCNYHKKETKKDDEVLITNY